MVFLMEIVIVMVVCGDKDIVYVYAGGDMQLLMDGGICDGDGARFLVS